MNYGSPELAHIRICSIDGHRRWPDTKRPRLRTLRIIQSLLLLALVQRCLNNSGIAYQWE